MTIDVEVYDLKFEIMKAQEQIAELQKEAVAMRAALADEQRRRRALSNRFDMREMA